MATDSKPIFLQISELICDRILNKIYCPNERIPSVRELAVSMEVNPNTVMRAFERLQLNEIIYMKRGLGYFISESAPEKIRDERKKRFLETMLPEVFREMKLLKLNLEELNKAFEEFNKRENSEKETKIK